MLAIMKLGLSKTAEEYDTEYDAEYDTHSREEPEPPAPPVKKYHGGSYYKAKREREAAEKSKQESGSSSSGNGAFIGGAAAGGGVGAAGAGYLYGRHRENKAGKKLAKAMKKNPTYQPFGSEVTQKHLEKARTGKAKHGRALGLAFAKSDATTRTMSSSPVGKLTNKVGNAGIKNKYLAMMAGGGALAAGGAAALHNRYNKSDISYT